jgi:A/G-specific adenine glycosylase
MTARRRNSRHAASFAEQVIAWQREHGRHGLPWQGTRDPYRVWLSEIMLQQTQVGTVIGYYDRFLRRFANVQALAAAPLDDVLALWAGLGYYSRARLLHRCAIEVTASGHPPPLRLPRSASASGLRSSMATSSACLRDGSLLMVT